MACLELYFRAKVLGPWRVSRVLSGASLHQPQATGGSYQADAIFAEDELFYIDAILLSHDSSTLNPWARSLVPQAMRVPLFA